jgi:hypothetical protein
MTPYATVRFAQSSAVFKRFRRTADRGVPALEPAGGERIIYCP